MFAILVGDWGILAALVITIAAFSRFFRSTVEFMLRDANRSYRLAARLSAGAVAVFMLWVTAFDNWRQLLGVLTRYTHDARRGRQSDPFFSAPTDDAVRFISYALLALAVLGMAFLFARYARGYWGPLVATPPAVALYYIFNAFRLRFDVESVRIADQSITGVWETWSTLVWIAGLWATFALLIFCAFIMLWGPAALIVAIVYRTTLGRVRYEEPEMFRIMRERNEARQRATENGPRGQT